MKHEEATKFVILAILDGWGLAANGPGNAIAKANLRNIPKFWASYPHTQLSASGESVGLPHGEVGNTQVGHLNIGAGRIVYQDLTRINMSIADGSFFENEVLVGAIDHAKENNSDLHLIGLLGAGGVHSSIEHLYALIQLASRKEFKRLFLHVFTDGRDSPTAGAATYIRDLQQILNSEGIGQIASVMGRYWAMDRDRRWDRTQKAYLALTQGIGHKTTNPEQALRTFYDKSVTDEFIEPTIVVAKDNQPIGVIKENDAVIFFNFRIDRPRQLTKTFVAKDFQKSASIWDFDPYIAKRAGTHTIEQSEGENIFKRGDRIKNMYFVMMTLYEHVMLEEGARVAYPPEHVDLSIGRVISEAGLRQLRVAESEKERFVTFYLNGQQNVTYPGEDRIIIPSPKVPTYEQKPEMSARETTEALIEKITVDSDYSLIVVNYANADMVGHSGNLGATVKACEVVDECIGKLANFALARGGTLLVTADHGNAEELINLSTGNVDTEHSANPVPFIAISEKLIESGASLQSGILADISPTILTLLGVPVADSMTGRNLLTYY